MIETELIVGEPVSFIVIVREHRELYVFASHLGGQLPGVRSISGLFFTSLTDPLEIFSGTEHVRSVSKLRNHASNE